MIERRTAIFFLNLVQDVNVLRPLMIMAARDFGFHVLILVSPKFRVRDLYGIWEAEIEILRAETDGRVIFCQDDFDAFCHLKGLGIIFSASESSLPEHGAAHSLFRFAPPSFLKVTLQHGFECVGFRHNAAHNLRYGTKVSFAADILCAWQPPELQPSLVPSQRPKVLVTGSTASLQQFGESATADRSPRGVVCENLHSIRLGRSGSLKSQFVETFSEFCRLLAKSEMEVVLRPHPGGQYTLKNKVELPANASVNNAPIYRLDLRQFAYGISAPSSVLIDMLLAGIPTAVWKDESGGIDCSNYDGLTQVSNAEEWFEFVRHALDDPDYFIQLQRRFLAEQMIPIEPSAVYSNYAEIFEAANRRWVRRGFGAVERQRLLLVANAHLPTVQVCLERPLQPLISSGQLAAELLTETRLMEVERQLPDGDVDGWIERALDQFGADAIILSRYSGPHASTIVNWANRNGVPTIFHIDDDLLEVPPSLGESKFAYHNNPNRLATVRYLLGNTDLVYASTELLRARLMKRMPEIQAIAGAINCSGRVIRTPANGSAQVIGYMASADHLPNLEMVLPSIVALLDRYPSIRFELFGSISSPPELERFGDRVTKLAPVAGYEEFLAALGERNWDIGICPLVPTDFNRAKSNNKWVEYTSLGIAAVASSGMVYDECCANGCGLLADGLDEWSAALERLATDDAARLAIVGNAQRKLQSEFAIPLHRQQILDVLELAQNTASKRTSKV